MFEINQNSKNQINELIGLGWEFYLHYERKINKNCCK